MVRRIIGFFLFTLLWSVHIFASGITPIDNYQSNAVGYNATWSYTSPWLTISSCYKAENARQGFQTFFSEKGIYMTPVDKSTKWNVEIALTGYGRRNDILSVNSPIVTYSDNRIELNRGDLIEWYINDKRGLEQGFTLWKQPETGLGDVTLTLSVTGTLTPQLMNEQLIGFEAVGQRFPSLYFRDLRVFDAGNRELPARFDSDGRQIRIVINDTDAMYPITVDPLVTSASWSTTETDYSFCIEWADWDNDGDLDLAVGNSNEANRVYENNDGVLTLAWSSTETDDTWSVAWGDWDNDGDLDLAVGNRDQANRVYQNNGGSLSLAWSSTETDDTWSVAWANWDGDNDLDLAVGNYSNQANRLYENTGGSLTLAWTSSETDQTRGIAWGDWDGDQDLDLAVGNYNQANRVYQNDGGLFTLAWTSSETDGTRKVAWGDYNNDGLVDLAVGNWNSNRLYQNTGGGLTSVWTSLESEDTRGLAWGDWDSDGDLDLAVANDGAVNRVYKNNGGALSSVWTSTETDKSCHVAWGDIDNDGDLDLMVANYDNQVNRLYLNSGGLLFSSWISTETDNNIQVAWGDWDNDGDLDLATAAYNQPNRVYDNTGGVLTLAWSSPQSEDTHSVAWGDWDGDGDLDLAAGNYNEVNRIYENTGGALSLAWTSTEIYRTRDLKWADWDGDGDLDLAEGTIYTNHLYENTGGNLTLLWSSSESEETRALSWGDWDGDGDLDLAVANYGTVNRVYENNGTTLVSAWTSSETDDSWSAEWGDWDGDGDLDLAVGNYGDPNRVYENTGGNLNLNWSSTETDDSFCVTWADWDGDGDLDLAVGNNNAQPNRVYENTGGSLALAWTSPEGEDTRYVAWGDWDNDGDPDLVASNYSSQSNRVYENGMILLPGLLSETPTFPVAADRPGTTASASFFSTPEVLISPVMISYKLFDEQSDMCFEIIPEYSPIGGGQWFTATQGSGGDGTTNLAASPLGTEYTFSWDAEADGVQSDNVVFRFTVLWQAPDLNGYPIQRPAISTVTPWFRVGFDADGDDVADQIDNCPNNYNPNQLLSSIGDYIWLDDNGDGIQDVGETGVEDIVVILYDSLYNIEGSTISDITGAFSFTDICPGNKILGVNIPSIYSFTAQNQGSDDTLDSDIDPMTGECSITLVEGDLITDVDAGLIDGCPGPDEPVWIYEVTLSVPEGYPILNFQDPNRPADVTGYNIYRSDDPGLPISSWTITASNAVDMDEVTPNIQWTDTNGATGDWYYLVTAYSAICSVEGPF